jgi:hypothetical protein
MTNTVYTSTNTSLQTIDTFVLPTEKIIHYDVYVTAGNTTHLSTLDISHDGIQTSEMQYSLAKDGITPLEFVVSIANNVGIVSVTPTSIPMTFSIERIAIACNLYSENTLSGRNIKTEEGLGIYFNSANNITIRQSNNNVFTYANAYVTSGVMGPIQTKDNLLLNYVDTNGSILTTDGDYLVVVSSGQKDNCQTEEISVLPGKRYILTGNAYYTADQNYSVHEGPRDTGASRIEVGTSFGSNDLGDYNATFEDTAFSIEFSADSDTIHVSFGFGDINNRLYVKDLILKEYAPFHTYNQDEGTIYLKWDAVVAGNTVLSLNSLDSNNRIYVDASNNIFINTVNCGAQSVTNKIAVSYSANGIVASRNGNAIISSADTFSKYIANAVFNSIPLEFAYMSNTISNTSMVTLSNV